jgi:hypothetical protein
MTAAKRYTRCQLTHTWSLPAMKLRIAFAIAVSCLLLATAPSAHSQELEPRSYTNVPTGLNFLIAGVAYQDGDMLVDPSIPAEDATTRMKHAVVGYLHSFGMFGKAAKFAVGGSYTDFSAQGLVEGEPKSREDQGFTDPGFKLSVNLLGSPALKLSEFKNYHQDLILGVSLGVTAPWGEYDGDRFINLGFNRWAVKPGIGVSKTLGRWIVEGSAAVAFFGDNTDFNVGQTRKQDPLLSLQVHTIYRIKPGGLWVSVDATYYEGGQSSVDDVQKDDGLSNYRLGATLALPVNRRNSIKLYASAGTNSRRGSEYDLVGIGWQYRWGDGL